MMTSRRVRSARVAAWRSLSISSLMIGVLLDVGVGARDVGFGLVVVVVGDEVLDGVVGEELFELRVELSGEGLVVGENERGAVHLFDDVGHREGLARAGDAQEGLESLAVTKPSTSCSMAAGWSPVGLRSETIVKSGIPTPVGTGSEQDARSRMIVVRR